MIMKLGILSNSFKKYTQEIFTNDLLKSKFKERQLPDFQTVSRCIGSAVCSKILARPMR